MARARKSIGEQGTARLDLGQSVWEKFSD
jgi:hypothetical protein